MSSLLLRLGLLGFVTPITSVWADVKVDVQCTKNKWTTNQLGQDPCTVGAKLQAQCLGGDFQIAALSQKDVYVGPLKGESNPCACSSVTYAVISACAACQGELWLRWSRWSANCTEQDISIASYTQAFPQDTSVPVWALENVTNGGVWNIKEALKIHNQGIPDITAASLSPTSSKLNPSSSPAPSPSVGQQSSNPGNTNGNGSNGNDVDHNSDDHDDGESDDHHNGSANAGTIAGGVIGGVVGLSALVLATICYSRRKRKSKKPREFFDPPDNQRSLGGHGRQMIQSPAPTVEPYVIPRGQIESSTIDHPSPLSNSFPVGAASSVSAHQSHTHVNSISPSPFSSASPVPSPPPPNTAYGNAAIYGRGNMMYTMSPTSGRNLNGTIGGYTGAAEV